METALLESTLVQLGSLVAVGLGAAFAIDTDLKFVNTTELQNNIPNISFIKMQTISL